MNIDIFKDLGVGIPNGLKSTDKQALIDIVNNAETNETTIKTNIVNALNSNIGTSLTSDSAWLNIQDAISNMTNKKWASGIITSASSTKSLTAYNGNADMNAYVQFDFSALTFIPSYVLFFKNDKSIQFIGGLWCKENFYEDGSNYGNANSYTMAFRVPYINGVCSIPVDNISRSYNWIAME